MERDKHIYSNHGWHRRVEKTFGYKSAVNLSKLVMTENSSVLWTCIGDINRSVGVMELLYYKK